MVPLPCCPERLDLAPERLETVSWKPVPPPERPKLALEMPEQACYRLEPAPESLNLALDRPEPVPVRPEPAPERLKMIALLEAQASLQNSSPFWDEAQKLLKNDKNPIFCLSLCQ